MSNKNLIVGDKVLVHPIIENKEISIYQGEIIEINEVNGVATIKVLEKKYSNYPTNDGIIQLDNVPFLKEKNSTIREM